MICYFLINVLVLDVSIRQSRKQRKLTGLGQGWDRTGDRAGIDGVRAGTDSAVTGPGQFLTDISTLEKVFIHFSKR